MSTQVFPYPQFPPQNQPAITGGGAMAQQFYYMLRALFLRTGGNSGVAPTVGTALSATGASQSAALALTDDYNVVTGGSGDGVSLFALQAGQQQVVLNLSGGNISVYPPSGGQINAITANDPYTLANGKTQIFWCDETLASGAPHFNTVTLG